MGGLRLKATVDKHNHPKPGGAVMRFVKGSRTVRADRWTKYEDPTEVAQKIGAAQAIEKP